MASNGGWGSGVRNLFGAGRAAMALGGRYWLCLLRDRQQYPGLRIGVMEAQFGTLRRHWGYGGAVMINARSPRREEALDFLIFLAGREYNELINHQADGMSPVKKFVETELFLRDPAFPEEDNNQVWRDEMAHGWPRETCEFINGSVADGMLGEQLDLVRNNQKTAEEAMKAAARKINDRIDANLKKNKALKARYDAILAGRTHRNSESGFLVDGGPRSVVAE